MKAYQYKTILMIQIEAMDVNKWGFFQEPYCCYNLALHG